MTKSINTFSSLALLALAVMPVLMFVAAVNSGVGFAGL